MGPHSKQHIQKGRPRCFLHELLQDCRHTKHTYLSTNVQNTYAPKFLVGSSMYDLKKKNKKKNGQYIYSLNTWFIINEVLHQWYSKAFLYPLCPQQYNINISDGNQVLLISHVKRKVPAGAPPPGPAMLIPELCYLTGCLLFVCLALVRACVLPLISTSSAPWSDHKVILGQPLVWDLTRCSCFWSTALHCTADPPEQLELRDYKITKEL